MKINLKKAIKHKGEEIYTIDLDLDALTGDDLIAAESQVMQEKGSNALQVLSFSRVFAVTVAAKALHMPVEVLRQMGARDFAKVVNEVQSFLSASDSEETTENQQEELSAV